ncbi:hypothetical protein NMY22_g8077 [Coprinellus aureogranulatus]|nr:hypothetical protein NMY22_g8077 [Coprinellus aureogranulatus]
MFGVAPVRATILLKLRERSLAGFVFPECALALMPPPYILRSTLHPSIIALAAEPHDDILEEESADLPGQPDSSDSEEEVLDDGDDDEERPPKSFGSIISWSHNDQVGALGVLYTILALILVHGRAMPDMDMRSFTKKLHLPPVGSPVHFSSTSTMRSLTVENYLSLLQRQGYLDCRSIGDAGKPGAGSKRVRATQAPRNDDENNGQMYEWRWGPRAMCEIGEQRIAEFIGEFMVEGEPVANERAKEAKVKKMVEGVEKAAGSKLVEVA